MKCQDALRFLSPYIDSELDPRTSFEIGEHLESCASCAERFAREEQLERRISSTLGTALGGGPEDAALWDRLERAVREEERRAAPPHSWRSRLLAAAALLAILLGGVYALRGERAAPLGVLGKHACHSHDGYVDGSERPEIVSARADEVASFLERGLSLAVRPPDTGLLEVVGARRCAFGNVRVAYVMGRVGRDPVSAFVFPSRELASFPEARAALAHGSGVARAAIHGHDVVVVQGRDLCACVVAAPGSARLEPIARALVADAP